MPGTLSRFLVTVSSTNHESCSIVMSSAMTEKKPIESFDTSTLKTCGSRIPSGRLPRTWSTAFLTSFSASITSTPISNSSEVSLLPSRAVELMLLTPWIDCSAASIFWVIWFSISVGAAPGWLIATTTIGNSMSGSFCTFIREKVTMPARTSPMNRMIGTTGLRMHQAEMLRKLISRSPEAPKPTSPPPA